MLLLYMFRLLQLPNTNTTISVQFGSFNDFGNVYIYLVVKSFSINLLLYYFTIFHTNLFPQDFNLLFQTNLKNCKTKIM